jgi:hypothetical protein
MFDKYFEYCSDVTEDLARQPKGMSGEEFAEYKNDLRNAIKEVSNASYVTSDGSHYKSKQPGIMKSGWYMTIIYNSISQLALHIEICLRLGMTPQQIVEVPVVVGGDDVVQRAMSCSKEEYIRAAADLGITLEIEENPNFENCEFFSHRFSSVNRSVAAIPNRFTKHIENLKHTAPDTEWGTLCSLMSEWVWDDEKFDFFYGIYTDLRDEYPDSFPIEHLPNKERLRAALDGEE